MKRPPRDLVLTWLILAAAAAVGFVAGHVLVDWWLLR